MLRIMGAALACFIVAGLMSCSGGQGTTGPVPSTPLVSTPADPDAAGDTAAIPVVMPVKMRPQAVVEPGFRTTSLARPNLLNPGLPAPRRVSDTGELITVAAGDYDPGLGWLNVEVKDELLVFDSQIINWEYDSLDNAAWCCYNIDLTGYSGIPTLSIIWDEQAYPILQDEYWVAIANYDRNCWDFFEGPLDQVITLESLAPYTSDSGRMVVVPIIIVSARILLLHELKLGVAEVRATGLQEGEATFETIDAEYYIGGLPESVDLSAGCAGIHDQYDWGSCTAFALADGAYNHELGMIYGAAGWDLQDDSFRMGPKYIYVESGKDPEHIPSPYIGRMLAVVAGDLLTRGSATEQHAPYDLEYIDDWSEEALADAEVLRTEAAIGIPVTADGTISMIKHVLAHWGKTVYISTYADDEFYDYEAGDIWEYSGPAVSSHAMLIVGYNDGNGAFLVRNCWGEDWGINGHCWIRYESLINEEAEVVAGYLIEEYSPTVAERFLGEVLDTPPPVNLQASQGTSMDSVQLTWDSTAAADSFLVYRDERTDPVATTDTGTWTDTSLDDGLGHTYWVRALYGEELSTWSPPATGFIKSAKAEIIDVTPTRCGRGQLITFEPLISGWGPVTYAWDFDGAGTPNTSTEDTPTILLGKAGYYDATVTITDTFGSSTLPFTLTVVNGLNPSAELSASPAIARPGEPVDFDGSGSHDTDGRIVLYEWDWEGDGTYDEVSTAASATHTYTEYPAELAPVLRITDGSGLTDTASCDLLILDT